MSKMQLRCWQCGAEQNAVSLPLSRTDTCRACSAELHVCCFCKCYRPGYADFCTEDSALTPRNAKSANFCDYFQINSQAYEQLSSSGRSEQSSRDKLNALFGAPESTESASDKTAVNRQKLESLFSKKEE